MPVSPPRPLRASPRALARSALLAVVLVLGLGLAACSGNPTGIDERLTRLTPDVLYKRAADALRDGDFDGAIRMYEALNARYPFAAEARQGRIDIIYAYYRRGERESALDAADQFIRENPAHPRIDYAWYLKGLIDFERTPYKVERWFSVDLAERPPATARDSFVAFRTVVERFPKSVYAHDARLRMVYLRNRLADYEMKVASYYERRGAWVAAARRASLVIEQYDGAPAVQSALRLMAKSYQELGYTELATNTERVYRENYPDAPDAQLASKRSWWHLW